jgi:hypothetical protein
VTVSTPALVRWFAAMDSDSPDDVLSMITDDFHMSVQFSRGAGQSSEFVGDRQGLIGYLEQREKSTLIHHVLAGSRVGQLELVLGKTTGTATSRPRSTRPRRWTTRRDCCGVCSSVALPRSSSPRMTESPTVRTRVDDHLWRITVDRPDRGNAVDPAPPRRNPGPAAGDPGDPARRLRPALLRRR